MIYPVVHLVANLRSSEHVLQPDVATACDCWCEPTGHWECNQWRVWIYVVVHNDELPIKHEWITHALLAPDTYPAAPDRDIPEKGPDDVRE